MDQKLLLSFQYASNVAGLTVPWDEIGRVLGEEITGSAVIQHLAKTRTRMLARGLEVPPPLRRGGGSARIPTTGNSAAPKASTSADKSKLKAKPKAKPAPKKAKRATKKGNAPSDDSDSDSDSDDEWKDDGSDAEYGKPAGKRATAAKGPMKRKVKTEDSDKEDTPLPKAPKRKGTSDFKPGEERSAHGYTDINGVPIDDDDMEIEVESENEIVGAGEPWLDLDEDHASNSTTGKQTPVKKSLVVSLPTTPVKAEAPKVGDEENHEFGDTQNGFDNYQVEEHQTFSDPFTNASTAGYTSTADFVNTNGYGGGYENDGGYQSHNLNQDGAYTGSFAATDGGYNGGYTNVPNAFGTDMTGAGTISDAYNYGNGNTVPYPIQTSWPEYQAPSHYTSVNQTPAATSAGPDFTTGGYFGDDHFDIGAFNDGGYTFAANNDNLFNTDDIDGNFVSDHFFSSNNYGN